MLIFRTLYAYRNSLVSQQLSHAFFGAWLRLRTFLFLEEEK